MAEPLFDYVPQIRQADKYIDVSRSEIRRYLGSHGKCHLLLEHEIASRSGDVVTATLRLNINTVSDRPYGWTMALKLHNKRIDGFDWESGFDAMDGDRGHGWHRHEWNAKHEEAEILKVAVDSFDGITTQDEFLIRGMNLLRIQLNAKDLGQDLFDLQLT